MFEIEIIKCRLMDKMAVTSPNEMQQHSAKGAVLAAYSRSLTVNVSLSITNHLPVG